MLRTCGGGVLFGSIAVSVLGASALADTATLVAKRDTTIFSSAPGTNLSSGEGVFLWCGRTGSRGGGTISRTLVTFDLTSIPVGSTIQSVQFKLRLEAAAPSGGTQTSTLHKVLGAWGEGTSNSSAGNGVPATPGDASWNFRIVPTTPWTTVGGEFVATPSATLAIAPTTSIPTFSSAAMVTDVQGWVNDPDSNFGWMVRGNEAVTTTARKFASREISVPASRPQLIVTFTPPPPCIADFNGVGGVTVQDIFDFLFAWFSVDPRADVNGQGGVTVQDVFDFLSAWFTNCP